MERGGVYCIMDSGVLWSAVIAVWEGNEARANGLATR
jgi:hypothetical protein